MSSPCCSLTCLGYPGASSHPPPSTLLPPTQVWTTAVQPASYERVQANILRFTSFCSRLLGADPPSLSLYSSMPHFMAFTTYLLAKGDATSELVKHVETALKVVHFLIMEQVCVWPAWAATTSPHTCCYFAVLQPWVPVRELAHRLVCWAFRGPPLLESMECAHLCGCANCLAPLHLVWVTCHQNDKMREWHAAVPGRLGQMCPRRVWERA